MRADHVSDIQERQPHLRRDVVGDRLRERVGHVPFAQPRLQVVVEPPRGPHRRHEHLMAPRIEQDPLQLRDVRQDEGDQRLPRPRLDVALQGGDGRLVLFDELGDDGQIGLDRGWWARQRGTAGRADGTLVRQRRDEVAAFEDGLQRIADQRIALPKDLQDGGAARWRSQALGDIDEQTPASLVHRGEGRQLEQGEPQGLHGVGHHLLMADGDVDVVLLVAGRGDGEQCGDRPALDDLETVIDQAPFDVLGVTEVRFDPPS